MKKIKHLALRYCKDTSGATAIEYALIASLIALAIIGGVTRLGNGISNTWNTISTEYENAG